MAVPSTARGHHTWLLIAAALPFVIMFAIRPVRSAPVFDDEQHHLDHFAGETGCYYNYQHYGEGDRIITNEPCLNCTCHNRMLMCYLRVCPFTKAIGQDCTVEKRADQCCPIITCPEVPVTLLSHPAPSTTARPSSTSSTAVGHPDSFGCTIDNEFYADGAQVPTDRNNPCELCYCIRNRTACVMQECTLNVEGCKPVLQDGVCCPVRYECDYPEEYTTVDTITGVPSTTTTTMSPNLGCRYNDDEYADGAMIEMEDKPCEHCYCMRGDIVCAVQECGTPLEKEANNCTALPPQPGKCCPEMYRCDSGEPADAGGQATHEHDSPKPQEHEKELVPHVEKPQDETPQETVTETLDETPTQDDKPEDSHVLQDTPEKHEGEGESDGIQSTTDQIVENELAPVDDEPKPTDAPTEANVDVPSEIPHGDHITVQEMQDDIAHSETPMKEKPAEEIKPTEISTDSTIIEEHEPIPVTEKVTSTAETQQLDDEAGNTDNVLEAVVGDAVQTETGSDEKDTSTEANTHIESPTSDAEQLPQQSDETTNATENKDSVTEDTVSDKDHSDLTGGFVPSAGVALDAGDDDEKDQTMGEIDSNDEKIESTTSAAQDDQSFEHIEHINTENTDEQTQIQDDSTGHSQLEHEKENASDTSTPNENTKPDKIETQEQEHDEKETAVTEELAGALDGDNTDEPTDSPITSDILQELKPHEKPFESDDETVTEENAIHEDTQVNSEKVTEASTDISVHPETEHIEDIVVTSDKQEVQLEHEPEKAVEKEDTQTERPTIEHAEDTPSLTTVISQGTETEMHDTQVPNKYDDQEDKPIHDDESEDTNIIDHETEIPNKIETDSLIKEEKDKDVKGQTTSDSHVIDSDQSALHEDELAHAPSNMEHTEKQEEATSAPEDQATIETEEINVDGAADPALESATAITDGDNIQEVSHDKPETTDGVSADVDDNTTESIFSENTPTLQISHGDHISDADHDAIAEKEQETTDAEHTNQETMNDSEKPESDISTDIPITEGESSIIPTDHPIKDSSNESELLESHFDEKPQSQIDESSTHEPEKNYDAADFMTESTLHNIPDHVMEDEASTDKHVESPMEITTANIHSLNDEQLSHVSIGSDGEKPFDDISIVDVVTSSSIPMESDSLTSSEESKKPLADTHFSNEQELEITTENDMPDVQDVEMEKSTTVHVESHTEAHSDVTSMSGDIEHDDSAPNQEELEILPVEHADAQGLSESSNDIVADKVDAEEATETSTDQNSTNTKESEKTSEVDHQVEIQTAIPVSDEKDESNIDKFAEIEGSVSVPTPETNGDQNNTNIKDSEQATDADHQMDMQTEIPVSDEKDEINKDKFSEIEENMTEPTKKPEETHQVGVPVQQIPPGHPAMQDFEESNVNHFEDIDDETDVADSDEIEFKPESIPNQDSSTDANIQHEISTDIPLKDISEPSEDEKHADEKPDTSSSESSEEVTEVGEIEASTSSSEEQTESHVSFKPDVIPGEDSCMVDGKQFINGADIPPANACQESCVCKNSIVHCTLKACPPPPSNNPNCMPMYQDGKCCPLYTCVDDDGQIISTLHEMEGEMESDKPLHADPMHESETEVPDKIKDKETDVDQKETFETPTETSDDQVPSEELTTSDSIPQSDDKIGATEDSISENSTPYKENDAAEKPTHVSNVDEETTNLPATQSVMDDAGQSNTEEISNDTPSPISNDISSSQITHDINDEQSFKPQVTDDVHGQESDEAPNTEGTPTESALGVSTDEVPNDTSSVGKPEADSSVHGQETTEEKHSESVTESNINIEIHEHDDSNIATDHPIKQHEQTTESNVMDQESIISYEHTKPQGDSHVPVVETQTEYVGDSPHGNEVEQNIQISGGITSRPVEIPSEIIPQDESTHEFIDKTKPEPPTVESSTLLEHEDHTTDLAIEQDSIANILEDNTEIPSSPIDLHPEVDTVETDQIASGDETEIPTQDGMSHEQEQQSKPVAQENHESTDSVPSNADESHPDDSYILHEPNKATETETSEIISHDTISNSDVKPDLPAATHDIVSDITEKEQLDVSQADVTPSFVETDDVTVSPPESIPDDLEIQEPIHSQEDETKAPLEHDDTTDIPEVDTGNVLHEDVSTTDAHDVQTDKQEESHHELSQEHMTSSDSDGVHQGPALTDDEAPNAEEPMDGTESYHQTASTESALEGESLLVHQEEQEVKEDENTTPADSDEKEHVPDISPPETEHKHPEALDDSIKPTVATVETPVFASEDDDSQSATEANVTEEPNNIIIPDVTEEKKPETAVSLADVPVADSTHEDTDKPTHDEHISPEISEVLQDVTTDGSVETITESKTPIESIINVDSATNIEDQQADVSVQEDEKPSITEGAPTESQEVEGTPHLTEDKYTDTHTKEDSVPVDKTKPDSLIADHVIESITVSNENPEESTVENMPPSHTEAASTQVSTDLPEHKEPEGTLSFDETHIISEDHTQDMHQETTLHDFGTINKEPETPAIQDGTSDLDEKPESHVDEVSVIKNEEKPQEDSFAHGDVATTASTVEETSQTISEEGKPTDSVVAPVEHSPSLDVESKPNETLDDKVSSVTQHEETAVTDGIDKPVEVEEKEPESAISQSDDTNDDDQEQVSHVEQNTSASEETGDAPHHSDTVNSVSQPSEDVDDAIQHEVLPEDVAQSPSQLSEHEPPAHDPGVVLSVGDESEEPVKEVESSGDISNIPVDVPQMPHIPSYPDPEMPSTDEEEPFFTGYPDQAPDPGSEIMPQMPTYDGDDQNAYGPGTCRYGGKIYVSAQQIPRDDPCDFCFCFRSDIICLQQSCPPPIKGCHEEAIDGFCCPRYECPVPMGITNTTTTTTTTTTLPPDLISSYIYGRQNSRGCVVQGRHYDVGDKIPTASGPCLDCSCGGDSKMECEPKACSPQPMLRRMMEAVSLRR